MLICISSICKSLCGIAAGATGAAIAEHWGGQRGNIADVLAKNGAQHTVVSLLGLAISLPFANFVNKSRQRLILSYILLTTMHIYSNIIAMKLLALRSINFSRLNIMLETLFNNDLISDLLIQSQSSNTANKQLETKLETILSSMEDRLSLKHIASIEPLFTPIAPHFMKRFIIKLDEFFHPSKFKFDGKELVLWSLPSEAIRKSKPHVDSSSSYSRLLAYKDTPYCVLLDNAYSALDCRFHVCFRDSSHSIDHAKGIFEAFTTRAFYHHFESRSNVADKEGDDVIVLIRNFVDIAFPLFWARLTVLGWDTNRLLLEPKNQKVYRQKEAI